MSESEEEEEEDEVYSSEQSDEEGSDGEDNEEEENCDDEEEPEPEPEVVLEAPENGKGGKGRKVCKPRRNGSTPKPAARRTAQKRTLKLVEVAGAGPKKRKRVITPQDGEEEAVERMEEEEEEKGETIVRAKQGTKRKQSAASAKTAKKQKTTDKDDDDKTTQAPKICTTNSAVHDFSQPALKLVKDKFLLGKINLQKQRIKRWTCVCNCNYSFRTTLVLPDWFRKILRSEKFCVRSHDLYPRAGR